MGERTCAKKANVECAETSLLKRIEKIVELERHTGGKEYSEKIQGFLIEAEAAGDIVSKAYCHALLSEYYYDFFDDELFRYHLIESCKHPEEIRETNPHSAAITYNMMGIDEFNQGNLELALEYYMNVIDVSSGSERSKYIAMLNIACIHGSVGNIKRKLDFVKPAYEYFLNNCTEVNYVARLHSICKYIECEVGLGNLQRIEKLVGEMDDFVADAGEAVSDLSIIEASRIYYYMLKSDDEGIESQLPAYIDKLKDVGYLVDYVHDITDICFELMKYGKFSYVKQIIDATFDRLVNCEIPVVAISMLELCIAYYEAVNESEKLDYVKELYYESTVEKREKDRIRLRGGLEFHESMVNIKLQRNQAVRENMRLQVESNTDALTGLPNRRMINIVAEQSFEKAFLEKNLLGFEILDIDYFKQINDTYGHQYGDECLRGIADILHKIADEDERIFAARYGGDEFCVIYCNMTDEEIREIALRIKNEVLALEIASKGSEVSEYLTVTQGIRNSVPDMRNRTWDFMFAADNALYRVKEYRKGEILIVHTYKDGREEWSSIGEIPA